MAKRYSVSYISLVISPTSNVKNMSIKINIAGGAYEMFEGGESKTINNLVQYFTYFLIFPSKNGHKMTLNLTTNYIDKDTFSDVSVYEFGDITRENVLKSINCNFNYDIKNSEKRISLNYIVRMSNTNMIGIRIIPRFNIEYITALINLESYYYDLYFEHSKKLSDIKVGNSYKFYIQTESLQITNISLAMKYNNLYKPFSYINIYENKLKYSSEHNKTSTHLISSQSETFLYQMSKYDFLHLILEIIPNYDFEQLNITINFFDGAFEIKNEESKDIEGLLSGVSYYIFIPSLQLQALNVGIKMDYMPSQPFNYIDIYEYTQKQSLDYNYHENKSISFYKNNSQLEANIIYENSFSFNYFSYYTVFKIKPIENIKFMSISLDINGGVFDFTR